MLADGTSLDSLTPAAYRERYLEFKRIALERAVAFMPDVVSNSDSGSGVAPTATPDDADVVTHARIPGGWYWSGVVRRGETLRIVNTAGTPGVSALFWNADETSERYNAGDTVKIQWNARLTTGRLLLSDMGRVLVSIAADTSGLHDTLLGGSTRATASGQARNTRENFLLAAAKHGLDKRDIAPCVTFFAGVSTTDDGHFTWHDDPQPAGRYVDLLAAMNVLVVLSNAPHPLAPTQAAPGAIDAYVLRSTADATATASASARGTSGAARYATGEAERAFENTEAMFRA